MSEANGSAIELRQHETALAMVVEPSEALARLKQLQEFVRGSMVQNVDYGRIPGTDKDTLLQPGAQKLAEIYGFAIDYEDRGSVEDFEKPLFVFRKRCVLRSKRDGSFVSAGVGSCNSLESKYGARWVAENEVPSDLDTSRLRFREREDWVFEKEIPPGVSKASLPWEERTSKRTGRPYRVYRVSVRKYQVPNEQIYDQVNTLEKMACKRALVMAVIGATRSAGIFTQDLEDMPHETPEPLGGMGKVEDVAQMDQPYADEAPPKRSPAVDMRPLEVLFNMAQTIEEVREAAKRVKALAALSKEQLAHLRKVRAAAEERITKAAATPPPTDAPAENAAPPVVDAELLEPGAMG